MKKIFAKGALAFLFLVPGTGLAAGSETILGFTEDVPKFEFFKESLPVNPELSQRVDALSLKLEEILNAVWFSGNDVYQEKQKELSPKIEKIRSEFVNPASESLFSGDEKSAQDLLAQGEKEAEELLSETKKWAEDQRKEDTLLQLEIAKNTAEMARKEITDLTTAFSADFTSAEKAKMLRLEKLADYYQKRAFSEYEKAKAKVLVAKDDENFWQLTAPVETARYRLENLVDRFERIFLGE